MLTDINSDFVGSSSSAVTVTNNSGSDFDGPNITNIKITPQVVNNHGGVITISYRATDTSGIDSITIIDHHLTFANSTFYGTNFSLSGTNQDGTFTQLPLLLPPQHIPLEYME